MASDGENFWGIIAFILLVMFLISIWAGIDAKYDFKDEIKQLKIQAVERGHAEWKVDGEGRTEWQWNIKEKADE